MPVFRLDRSGALTKVERTPQGGLRMDAGLTRAGVLEYVFNGKTVREYRPLEEVSRADSLATLRDAPVTFRHPPGKVTPKNFKTYASGHLSGDARMDGDIVVGSLAVQDERLVSAVERRDMTEVSCGYTCDIEETPGQTAAGEPYDRIQRNITYNHVAIVERGRAGRDVALRLDSEGNATSEELSMTEAEIQALKAENEANKARADKAEGELTVARSSVVEQTTRADAAEATIAKAESAAKLGGIVAAAKLILGSEFKADGLDELAVKSAVVAKSFPGVDLKDKTLAFVDPIFTAATSAKPVQKRADAAGNERFTALRVASRPEPKAADDMSASEKAAAGLRKDSEEAWKKPLALTK